MRTPQITTPQKTSFWDFKHKRVYVNRKEKFYDFLDGLLFGIMYFVLMIVFYYLAPFVLSVSFYLAYIDLIIDLISVLFLLPYLILLIYLIFKRKYFFFGALLILLIFTFFYLYLYIDAIINPPPPPCSYC